MNRLLGKKENDTNNIFLLLGRKVKSDVIALGLQVMSWHAPGP